MIVGLDRKFTDKFNSLDRKFNGLEQKFTGLDQKVDRLDRKFTGQIQKLTEGQINLRADMVAMETNLRREIRNSQDEIIGVIQDVI